MSGPSIASAANGIPQWSAYAPITAVKNGQQATTASAAPLPNVALTSHVTLKAPKANAAAVEIGTAGVTTATGFVLDPGDQVTLSIPNLQLVYMIGANTTDKITWIGF